MAEKLLHEEDVIFKKPSLKEFIRLIKNGTINAIWPSTDKEFIDWNDGGYTKYPKGQPIKSQKTAMTIYYGDNQDATGTEEIDVDNTKEKYNQIISDITTEKEKIVELNYYDNINSIYPSSNEYALSLNQETGEINNKENVINYKTNIEEQYRQYTEKIENFIKRINDFKGQIDTESFTLDDADLIEKYNDFFTSTTYNINSDYKNIILPTWDAEEDIESTLIDKETSIYDFSKILDLHREEENNISNVINTINQYYRGTDQELKINTSFLADLKLTRANYISYLTDLEQLIKDYYESWEETRKNNIDLLKQLNSPELNIASISGEKLYEYNNDTDLLFQDHIDPYKTLFIDLYTLKNNCINMNDEATTEWTALTSSLKDEINQLTDIEQKASHINNNFATVIKNYIMSCNITLEPIKKLYVLSTGTFKDIDIIFEQLELSYNIISLLEKIFSEYENLIPVYLKSRTPILLENYLGYKANIISEINRKIAPDNNGFILLKSDQNKVLNDYDGFKREYHNFLIQLKNLNITSAVDLIPNFILESNGITNIQEVKSAIENQLNKILNHYNALLSISDQSTQENISINILSSINTNYTDIVNRINTAIVETTYFGNENYFIDQVIKPNSPNESYTIEAIQLLLKRITNNTITFESDDQIIPEIESDFLSIRNKTVVIDNLYKIINAGKNLNRLYVLSTKIDNINKILQSFQPIYLSEIYSHYTCIAVGSDIEFPNKIENSNPSETMPDTQIDGSVTIKVDGDYYYPKINGQTSSVTTDTRDSEILTVGALASMFGGEGKITERNVGSSYSPMYLLKGQFTPCANAISGTYVASQKGGTTYWNVIKYENDTEVSVGLQAKKLFGAVYNDYAEYRKAEAEPGRCIIENGDGTLSLSTGRLQLGANIVSDTYGFAIGETNDATCPIAVCGRVLVYPLESKEVYHPGAAVCSGPEGTISLMTREEIREWPDAIVGYVSEVPTYDTWGTDNVPVNGRIWIKIK